MEGSSRPKTNNSTTTNPANTSNSNKNAPPQTSAASDIVTSIFSEVGRSLDFDLSFSSSIASATMPRSATATNMATIAGRSLSKTASVENFPPSLFATGIKKSISVSSEHSNNSEMMELVHSSMGSINFSSSLSGAETTTTATTATITSNNSAVISSTSSPIHHHSTKKLWGSIDLINRRKFSAHTPSKFCKNEEGGENGKAGASGVTASGTTGSQGTLDKSESPTGSPKTERKMWYGGSRNASINSVGTEGTSTPKATVSAHRDSVTATLGGEGGATMMTMTTPPKHKLLTGIKDALNKARKSLPNIAAGSIDKLSSLNLDPLEEEAHKSKVVEQYLKKEKQKFLASQREPRVLILGTTDSGKSTFIKLMKILYASGFSEREKEQAKKKIVAWLIYSLDKIIYILEEHDISSSLQSPDQSYTKEGTSALSSGMKKLASNASIASSLNTKPYKEITLFKEVFFDGFTDLHKEEEDGVELPERICELVLEAVKDPALLFVLNYASKIHSLPETMPYFFERAADIVKASYCPTDQDILNLRTATKSISTTTLTIDDTPVHFIDVSGLLHHRKTFNINKVPYFDDVNSILYMVSLSSFDQTVVEDGTINRLQDSVAFFDQVVHNPLLQNTHIIIFFNKKDLFVEKAKTVSLNLYFPEYKGKANDSKMYFDFIKKMYIRQIRYERRNNNGLSIHVTKCNNIDSMKAIVGEVITKVIERRLVNAVF